MIRLVTWIARGNSNRHSLTASQSVGALELAWLGEPGTMAPLGVAEIEQLTQLFDSQNLAAVDQFTSLSSALEQRLGTLLMRALA